MCRLALMAELRHVARTTSRVLKDAAELFETVRGVYAPIGRDCTRS
jgi:hypothetical protein